MTTKTLLQILTLVLFVVSCGQPNPNPIDVSNVDSIVMYSHFPDDTIAPPARRLSMTSIKTFAEIWNSQYPADHCKYYPNYLLTVYLKDKRQRAFRVNGQNIKEKTDECFNFSDPEYFDNLWENNK